MSHHFTRRKYLKTAAASGIGLLAGTTKSASQERAEPEKGKGYIDAHVHVWTPDTERYPLAPNFKKEDMKPPSFTPEELFMHQKGTGVDRTNLIQMSYYGFDNSYMLDEIQRYPDKFVGTAIVDPFGADPSAKMVELSKHRCFAFRIHPGHTKQPPESWLQPEPVEKMFETASDHHLALSALIGLDCLPELDRMCTQYPEAPAIIDHLCRIGAGKFPINDENISKLAAMAKHKNVYLKIGAFYALGERQPPYLDLLPMIERLVEAFTPARCMWETDSPFQVVHHTYEDSLSLIRDHAEFLSASDKEAILRDTAAKLLFRV